MVLLQSLALIPPHSQEDVLLTSDSFDLFYTTALSSVLIIMLRYFYFISLH